MEEFVLTQEAVVLGRGMKRYRVVDGREGCRERFSAESDVYSKVSSMQNNYPYLGGRGGGQVQKEGIPQGEAFFTNPRSAQGDWNSEFKVSRKERWIEKVSKKQTVKKYIT